MEKPIKLVCAGFGGQGVLTIGQLVAMIAMNHDYLVSWMPSYGPEMRGGTANCHVVISKDKQQSPIISNDMTHLLALNQLAKDKFKDQLVQDGQCIIHQALVKQDLDMNELAIDFNQIASQLDNTKTANMAAFGSLMVTLNLFKIESGEQIIREKFALLDKQLLEDNIKAYYMGVEAAQALIS